jgi:hypothetical protein
MFRLFMISPHQADVVKQKKRDTLHLPADGCTGQPKHVAMYNKGLFYWIFMVVFGRIDSLLRYTQGCGTVSPKRGATFSSHS